MPTLWRPLCGRSGIDVSEEMEAEDNPELGMADIGRLEVSCPLRPCPSCDPLTFLEEATEGVILFSALPNQCENPCLKLKPPGGRRSSSVALTVSELRDPVL